MEEHQKRKQQDKEEALTLAYLNAYWPQLKRMPSLKKVLAEAKPRKLEPQTPEQMFNAIKRLHAEFAGEEG